MTDEELLAVFSRILGDLLGNEDIALSMASTRADFPGWDSFNYVNFIVVVEAELGIKFRIADVESFATVGDIVAGAQALLRSKGNV
jgi:acyl carrier protein